MECDQVKHDMHDDDEENAHYYFLLCYNGVVQLT
jgi:hypothetical protein